jgi:hypothetical protein
MAFLTFERIWSLSSPSAPPKAAEGLETARYPIASGTMFPGIKVTSSTVPEFRFPAAPALILYKALITWFAGGIAPLIPSPNSKETFPSSSTFVVKTY